MAFVTCVHCLDLEFDLVPASVLPQHLDSSDDLVVAPCYYCAREFAGEEPRRQAVLRACYAVQRVFRLWRERRILFNGSITDLEYAYPGLSFASEANFLLRSDLLGQVLLRPARHGSVSSEDSQQMMRANFLHWAAYARLSEESDDMRHDVCRGEDDPKYWERWGDEKALFGESPARFGWAECAAARCCLHPMESGEGTGAQRVSVTYEVWRAKLLLPDLSPINCPPNLFHFFAGPLSPDPVCSPEAAVRGTQAAVILSFRTLQ